MSMSAEQIIREWQEAFTAANNEPAPEVKLYSTFGGKYRIELPVTRLVTLKELQEYTIRLKKRVQDTAD